MKNFFLLVQILLLTCISFSCGNESLSPQYVSVKAKVDSFPEIRSDTETKEDTLEFRYKMVNLGVCRKDTTITLRYYISNQGQRPVTIGKVHGSCGCLSFEYKNTIFPCAESEVKVIFKSGSVEGYFKKEIYISFTSGRIITFCFYVSVV